MWWTMMKFVSDGARWADQVEEAQAEAAEAESLVKELAAVAQEAKAQAAAAAREAAPALSQARQLEAQVLEMPAPHKHSQSVTAEAAVEWLTQPASHE